MSFVTLIFAMMVPLGCIAAAIGLMRLFDTNDATPEQLSVEVEKLLEQASREVRVVRRVRAAATTSVI